MWYKHKIECYSAIKENATTQRNFENSMLNKTQQTQKDKQGMIPLRRDTDKQMH
jgi:hypothetical protein